MFLFHPSRENDLGGKEGDSTKNGGHGSLSSVKVFPGEIAPPVSGKALAMPSQDLLLLPCLLSCKTALSFQGLIVPIW